MNRKALYWICQLGGWAFFFLIQSFIILGLSLSFTRDTAITLLFYSFFGLFLSHAFRTLIIRADWLRLGTLRLIPRVLGGIILLGAVLHFLNEGLQFVLTNGQVQIFRIDVRDLTNIVALSIWFFLWSLIYFLFHYVENYKKAEIENLRWQASINEIELNKLKSQLNPHFMFNAMNSIRALVDENPARAKDSITQLSNILRNTLQMGKNKVISFSQEFSIVKDYLELEGTRFEERLKVKLEIDPLSEDFELPPLMIQTLVENGIKHGISRLPGGGEISIRTKADGEKLHIFIRNSGQINGSSDSDSGFGLKNSMQRLKLLYGSRALLNICNESNNTVLTELVIPKMN
jgi:two-component system, LytTR family, sensor kinase